MHVMTENRTVFIVLFIYFICFFFVMGERVQWTAYTLTLDVFFIWPGNHNLNLAVLKFAFPLYI